MSRIQKLITKILSGLSDRHISFADLISVLQSLGFTSRINGSHHIFWRQDIDEIINIQPNESMAKPYQVKQVRSIIIKYKIGADDESEI